MRMGRTSERQERDDGEHTDHYRDVERLCQSERTAVCHRHAARRLHNGNGLCMATNWSPEDREAFEQEREDIRVSLVAYLERTHGEEWQ